MSKDPIIQAIETIPQLTAAGQPTFAICLKVAGGTAVYSDPLPQRPEDDLTLLRATVQNVIAPHFVGQSLAAFRPLATQLDELTETVTITEIVQSPAPAAEGTMSRRRLISGFLAEDQPAEPVETVYTESRPLPSALRYLFNLLFLQAVALAQQIGVRPLLVREFGQEADGSQTKLQAAVSDPAVAAIITEVAAIWHTADEQNIEKQLGANNIRLQSYARQLKEWLQQVTSTKPTICLDVRGGLGQLYNNNIGKILGAIYGLEYAAKPYPLAVIDPLFDQDPFALIKRLGDLKKYMGMRKLQTQIWARRIYKNAAEIAPLAEAGGIDGLQVDVAQWVTVEKIVEMMTVGQAAGLPLTFIYPPHIGAQEVLPLQELVAFTRPTSVLLTADLPQVYNTLKRQSSP